MDGVTRQTSQHVEYEPEWEGAFNLQLKLSNILTIVQDWCATDVSLCDLAFYNTFFISRLVLAVDLTVMSFLLYTVLIKNNLWLV